MGKEYSESETGPESETGGENDPSARHACINLRVTDRKYKTNDPQMRQCECVCVCMQKPTPAVFTLLSEAESLTEFGTHLFDEVGWPASLGELPVSISSAPG